MLNFPRETVEYLPFKEVSIEDEATGVRTATTAFDIAVVERGTRPAEWTPAPYLIQNLDPGTYEVFVRITDTPETPVTHAGSFIVT